MNDCKNEKQRGFTLVELMMAFVVAMMVLGGIVSGGMYVYGIGKLHTAKSQVQKLATAAEAWKEANNSSTYSGISMTVLASTLGGSATMMDPWGGAYSLAVSVSDPTKFVISFPATTDVSTEVAASVGPNATGSYGAGMVSITGP